VYVAERDRQDRRQGDYARIRWRRREFGSVDESPSVANAPTRRRPPRPRGDRRAAERGAAEEERPRGHSSHGREARRHALLDPARAPLDEERRQAAPARIGEAGRGSEHRERGGERVGDHALGMEHRHRRQPVFDGAAGAGVDGVRVAPAAVLEEAPVVARCRDRQAVERDDQIPGP